MLARADPVFMGQCRPLWASPVVRKGDIGGTPSRWGATQVKLQSLSGLDFGVCEFVVRNVGEPTAQYLPAGQFAAHSNAQRAHKLPRSQGKLVVEWDRKQAAQPCSEGPGLP